MLLITAPSKTQRFNNRDFPDFTIPSLLEETQLLVDKLAGMTRNQLSVLMKTSDKLTALTYNQIHFFHRPFSRKNSAQALFTFQGDSYKAITAGSYADKELRHAQQHLRILSGLYGILRPLDLMQPYRLEMGTRLSVKDAPNLHAFWNILITDSINQTLDTHVDKTVVNLASAEYAKTINRKKLTGRMVAITFRQLHKGKYKTIPIYSKRARGHMIHFMITNRIDRAEDLKTFSMDGYHYNEETSTSDNWYFFKK